MITAEYVLSLANLSWSTFNNAITEKYCDLFWQEELLVSLFEAVNDCKPILDGENNARLVVGALFEAANGCKLILEDKTMPG